ncbi:HutD/Ves family protein [Luteimonas aquatica]|uniref:HutD/Ves family protein n=1 Tax=Luteimonas aquatica TaxID=450364 RepID=UPI001F579447|nr:HutD family protein [Luteimonas aquatica]
MTTIDQPSSGSRVIPASAYRRERWRNGLGWTREIHAQASADGEGWDWRLSIAEIEQDAAFSAFPGVDRELVLLAGNGLRLRFDEGELHALSPPHGRLRFAGERGVVGELVDGPTRDFNLMWRRAACAADLHHRPLVGPMVFFAEPETTWALHLLAGEARFESAPALPPLRAGDTALLAESSRTRFLLEGGGELLAIRIVRGEALPSA